jgi:hypothetical protein
VARGRTVDDGKRLRAGIPVRTRGDFCVSRYPHLGPAGRTELRIGLLSDAEVTEAVGPDRLLVSQAFCSALPVAYSDISPDSWGPFAQLVLDAAYEATLCAAVLNARRGASHVVFLTLLGGGAFGNHTNWILSAIQRALGLTRHYDLDVRLVSYGAPSNELVAAIRTF